MDIFEPINATFYRAETLEAASGLTLPEDQRNLTSGTWKPRELKVPIGVNKIMTHWDGVSQLHLWTRIGGQASSVRRIPIQPGVPSVFTFATRRPNSTIWYSVSEPEIEPVGESVCGVTIIPGPLNSHLVNG